MSPEGVSRRSILFAGAATAVAAAAGLAVAPSASAAPTLPNGTSKKKVLVVGMDGLRYDRIEASDSAPHLKAMMANGMYATSLLYSEPMSPTRSGPGWATVSTGVWPDKHGVTNNEFTVRHFEAYPPLMTRLSQIRPDLSLYAAVDWKPLDTYDVIKGADAKLVLNYHDIPSDQAVANESTDVIRNQNPDVLFVYFGYTDSMGHEKGPLTPEYMDAIARQDVHLGRLQDAIRARPTYSTEDWLVIVTTDHGHIDEKGHGGSAFHERKTFILAQGSAIAAGSRPITTRLVDVAPSVYHHLGLHDPAWNLDGKPIQIASTDPFDTLQSQLQPRVDETGIPAGILGFTHTPPSGWSIDNSAMGTGGVTEWRGWTFTTDEFWSQAERNQWRETNVRARGVFAVADSDEWNDQSKTGNFDSTLVTPAYNVPAGKTKATIRFVTHYHQADQQVGEVLISFNAGTPTLVKRYTFDVRSQAQALNVTVPAGAISAQVRFRYKGDNDFFWVVDDVKLDFS
ncbi:alkaline phosphatase family protein [Kitasatospora sp. NPDC001574]